MAHLEVVGAAAFTAATAVAPFSGLTVSETIPEVPFMGA